LIEVLDFSKSRLSYKNIEVVKPPSTGAATAALQTSAPSGPSFRHVYNRLFGPTFPGEYIPPNSQGGEATGIYILSYPGIAFKFSIQQSAWSANLDFVALLSSSAASPASSMAIFNGSSWSDARANIFSRTPPHPRSLSLAGRGREGGTDEVELVKVHGEGCIELVRRFGSPFWIVLSETTPQDLVAELGPPDAIYRKNDRRLAIHKARSIGSRHPGGVIGMYGGQDESTDTDQSSSHTTDESDEDGLTSAGKSHDMASAECFYNYFHHGFDVFISSPTKPSARSPTAPHASPSAPPATKEALNTIPTAYLTATKFLLHANIPGSYPFNRHRRSRWTLEHVPSAQYTEPLNSEMPFNDIAGRLREVWKTAYSSEDEEKSSQRGMVLNRGWGDSPGSSCELLGGWEESIGGNRKGTGDITGNGEQSLGNTELFGFPGLVFEVLKNGAVSCLTVF
jgi:isoleucyl-tRNA synthetase